MIPSQNAAPIYDPSNNSWEIKTGTYRLAICGATGCVRSFHDQRDPKGVSITDRGRLFASFAYTLRDEDAVRGRKPAFTPYLDHEAAFPDKARAVETGLRCSNLKLGVSLLYQFFPDSVCLTLTGRRQVFSEFGLNLPFQFMGKKGTSYRHQFLPSTPYVSCDGAYRYWYLGRPNGHPVLISYLTRADGWKLDYSSYSYGHFIENLKILDSFDHAYGTLPKREHLISVKIQFPDSFPDALYMVSRQFHRPAVCLTLSGGKAGEGLAVRVIGDCDSVRVRRPDGTEAECPALLRTAEGETLANIPLRGYGIHAVVPYFQGKKGLDGRVFAYDGMMDMFRRNCLSLRKPFHIDENLCEGGVWAEAACRNMRLMGGDESLDRLVREQLGRVIPGPDGSCIPRCSIPARPAGGFPAYHVYRSMRVQEQFFGISFLIQAYRLYGDRSYLNHAVSSMMSLLRWHIRKNGKILKQRRIGSTSGEDYTTVTAPVIAVVDLARVLLAEGDSRFRVLEETAVRIADYLVKRGLDFPTEGKRSADTEKEMEDGSISCTALSVLYVCYYIRRKPEYLKFADKILRLHDAWVMQTPDARLDNSTLRWWETIWEGEADGPAICGGHAWTLWRGEADYYYSMLTCDTGRLVGSFNAFVTNMAKIKKNGDSYACFQPDYITGGQAPGSAVASLRLVGSYPQKTDQSLSKYLWVRMEDTWMKTAALLFIHGAESAVNGELRYGGGGARRLKPDLPTISVLYLDAKPGGLTVLTESDLHIVSKQKLSAGALYNPVHSGNNWYLTPQEGRIEVCILS